MFQQIGGAGKAFGGFGHLGGDLAGSISSDADGPVASGKPSAGLKCRAVVTVEGDFDHIRPAKLAGKPHQLRNFLKGLR